MLQSTARRHLTSRSLPVIQNLTRSRQYQASSRLYSEDPFDPKRTRPETQKDAGEEEGKNGAGTGTNPADASANKARDPQEGGRQGSEHESGKGMGDRQGQSAGGSPPKSGGGKSGGGGGT